MKKTKVFALLLLPVFLLLSCTPDASPGGPSPSPDDTASPSPSPEDASPSPAAPPLILTAPGAGFDFGDPPPPVFANAGVHDPSLFYGDGWYYVIGSHLASAKTQDFMQWIQLSTDTRPGNALVPDPQTEFADAFAFAETTTLWASDVQQMPCGRWFMYYCVCIGHMPLGAIGLAIADHPEGPYADQGMFIRSMATPPEGGRYDATIHPNAIDPHVFFCNDGDFWMVYGSYSGGIFILSMDPVSGLPYLGQENLGYGRKLLGGHHSRIEGPYIQYSPHTGYYYLFLTFGGLDAAGGYNMRIARSKDVMGPYFDARGQNMIDCRGPHGSFFDDRAIEPYGTKIMGGYQFRREEGEPGRTTGHLSPGHNSTYYCAETDRYFLIFHTRFTDRGEAHEVRVHEMFMNANGWFVVSPFRFDNGTVRSFTSEQLTGSWKLIDHEQDINTRPKISTTVNFLPDGTVGGPMSGSWQLGADGKTALITIDGVLYTGVFLRSWDNDHSMWVQAFTAMSDEGIALWGAGAALK